MNFEDTSYSNLEFQRLMMGNVKFKKNILMGYYSIRNIQKFRKFVYFVDFTRI